MICTVSLTFIVLFEYTHHSGLSKSHPNYLEYHNIIFGYKALCRATEGRISFPSKHFSPI